MMNDKTFECNNRITFNFYSEFKLNIFIIEIHIINQNELCLK